MKARTACLLAFIAISSGAAHAEDSVLEAQRVFKQFTDLERTFDPALADLFAPNAVVKDVRIYQDGQTKTITWSGTDYKQVLRAGLPVARLRNDLNTYSQVSFIREGNNVRVKTTRQCQLKKSSGPFEIVVAPTNANGRNVWKIVEETAQNEP